MNKKLNKRLSALDPRFRKQMKDLFKNIDKSIDLLYEAATHDEKTGHYSIPGEGFGGGGSETDYYSCYKN